MKKLKTEQLDMFRNFLNQKKKKKKEKNKNIMED